MLELQMQSYGNDQEKSGAIIALWEDLYRKKQKSWLSILSGSMIPLLQIGDEVLVHVVNPAEIRVGDMIVYKSNDKLIVHRVIRNYNSSSFLQKGDNTTTAEIVSSKDVIGTVIAIRKGTRIFYPDKGFGKIINLILTVFSCSVYYHKPKNKVLKRIARYFFKIYKIVCNYVL